ncbi:hypothetical protein [Microcystis sp. M061S2]|uniref:hypothetical protein n=1 Tax=Microcystis sp. M061S2 TaxID=2771171 RepID=UPI00258B992F|nr:hypothetical protein [Microcystis sp. M061S2]MCA2652879.1 hypothetical protein [Microcystis sp. M061S2]
MYINLSLTEAISLLISDDNAGWSWDGAEALAKYLEDLEDSLDKAIEFDRVSFRCEYSEYSSALEAAQDYGFTPPKNEDDDEEIESAAIAYLEDQTTVIKFSTGVIIQQF